MARRPPSTPYLLSPGAAGDDSCASCRAPRPSFKPRGQDFPRRNRIISGLAFGVVIVEAARRSGTLTTARFALEQGRSVYAVPGHPLDPRAEGTNRLIQKGATMVISADDVLSDLRPQLASTSTPLAEARPRRSRPVQPPPMADDVSDGDRASVVAALGPQPVHVDDLLRATGLAVPALQVALIELDLAGRLEHHGAQLVSLRLES